MLALVLVMAGCVGGENAAEESVVRYHHDAVRGVGCWSLFGGAISCLPDSQYQSP
jgi:hypothetical protein